MTNAIRGLGPSRDADDDDSDAEPVPQTERSSQPPGTVIWGLSPKFARIFDRGQNGALENNIIRLRQSGGDQTTCLASASAPVAVDAILRPGGPEIIPHGHGGESILQPPVSLLARGLRDPLRIFVKASEDLLLGLILLLLFAPLMLLIALAIKLDSKGPVFFMQKRHGLKNSEFEIFKFRSMRTDMVDFDCARQTSRDDPRTTRVGRFLRRSSLDELPQLINVLRGEMSLVGPRPHAINMRTQQRLCHEIVPNYANRHRVKPGMTGWAQINGCRGPTDTEEQLVRRVEFDIAYIERLSLLFDLQILFLTIFHLASPKNAY